MQIMSIYDNKAESFANPFTRPTTGIAIRDITDGLASDDQMSKNAKDFSLHSIGRFDPISGRITPNDPKHVIDISELLNKE